MPDIFRLPLHVQREVHGLSIVVRAAGEMDQISVGALEIELRTAIAIATPPFPVVADLSGLTFFGSAGLNEMLRQQRRATAAGVPLRIVASQRAVLRPITMSGLDQVLDVYPDVPQALSADRQDARTAG